MRSSTLTIFFILGFIFLLLSMPKLVVGFYIWTNKTAEFYAERAYYVALNLGAEGLQRNGTLITLRNGEQVAVVFSCVDLILVGASALLPFSVCAVMFSLAGIWLSPIKYFLLFLIIFASSVLMNIVRIATILYLANNYYDVFVKPVGWDTFHDSMGFTVLLLHTALWAFLAFILILRR